MADGATQRATIRRRNGERVKIIDQEGREMVILVRLGKDVVLDCEILPDGWRFSRVDGDRNLDDGEG